MKYVIIDAARAKISGVPALCAPNVILANDATLLNVPSNDAAATKTTTVATTTPSEPPQLNGKFLRLRILEENFGLR